ncbi:MAG TPA: SOS response-associated peptidase [Gammaproteobacteria bacterium]|nr:SOS response-associated peptidase [Gammaproteobacteria bacterium]
MTRQVGHYNARYNQAPGQPILNVSHRLGCDDYTFETYWWGFTPSWAPADHNGPKPINARKESLSRGMYRASVNHSRSVILCDGFFEPDKSAPSLHPQYYFHRRDEGLIALAGLYAEWEKAPDDKRRFSCAIITVPANETVSSIHHDRMPAILADRSRIDAWLDPGSHKLDDLQPLLAPAADELLARHRVDHRLLSCRDPQFGWYDAPQCIEPVE